MRGMNKKQQYPLMNAVGKALVVRLLPVAGLIQGERALMDGRSYSLMFDWFAGLTAWGAVWENAVCPDETAQLMQHEVSGTFL